MSTGPVFTVCLQWLGLLAAEAALAVALAALARRFIASACGRRTVWQVCLLSLLLLPLLEGSGVARRLADWLTRDTGHRAAPVHTTASHKAGSREGPARPVSDDFLNEVAGRLATGQSRPESATPPDRIMPPAPASTAARPTSARDVPAVAPAEVASDTMAVLALGLAWIAGSGVVLGRTLIGGLILVLVRLRRRAPADAALQARVVGIARTLGLSRRIRLMECPGLAGPMVFGAVLPALGVPGDFTKRFRLQQQDAILAHEVAHLAARDPLWYLLANAACALLWWQPLAWWARRQLHAASEQAADEACLVIPDGPVTLAESLVELGARLGPSRSWFRLGIEGGGSRSGLGRRVERLLKMREGRWTPANSLPFALARIFGPSVVAVAAIVSTAWASPRAFNQGESMKTTKQTWQRAAAALTLVMSLPGGSQAGTEPGTDRPLLKDPSGRPLPEHRLVQAPAAAGEVPTGALTAPQKVPSTEPASPTAAANPAQNDLENHEQSMRFMRARYGLMTGDSALGGQTVKSNERNVILSRLEKVTLGEVKFDGIPLSEALRFLSDESRKRDPDKRAINFLINPNVAVPAAVPTIDPTTGQPVSPPAPEPLDMNSVMVRFNLPLRDVRLKDVLDAMVKVADRPIEYTVEDYGVVFSAAHLPPGGALSGSGPVAGGPDAPPVQLQVRTFKVEADKLWPGIRKAFGVRVPASAAASPGGQTERVNPARLDREIAAVEASLQKLLDQPVPDRRALNEARDEVRRLKDALKGESQSGGGDNGEIQPALRMLLTQLGINMDVPGKSIYYNDLTGIVMVRATPDDLEVVKAAIETLGGYAAPDQSSSLVPNPGMNQEMMRRYGLLPAKP